MSICVGVAGSEAEFKHRRGREARRDGNRDGEKGGDDWLRQLKKADWEE